MAGSFSRHFRQIVSRSWSSAGFTDRLSVVQDLVHGNPARWPAASPQIRQQVVEVFGLPDPDEEVLGAERTASTYKMHYWMAFLVALAIPLLTIAFKIISPPELRRYYSGECQVLAGNVDAARDMWSQPGGRERLAELQGQQPPRGREGDLRSAPWDDLE